MSDPHEAIVYVVLSGFFGADIIRMVDRRFGHRASVALFVVWFLGYAGAIVRLWGLDS